VPEDQPTLALDPIVQEALQDLWDWTFNAHGPWYHRLPARKTLLDSSSRAYAIHTFKGLKHHGISFDPQAVLHWAQNHGWPPEEAVLLSDYAAGVAAGVRYHAGSPFGLLELDDLRRRVHEKRGGRGRDA